MNWGGEKISNIVPGINLISREADAFISHSLYTGTLKTFSLKIIIFYCVLGDVSLQEFPVREEGQLCAKHSSHACLFSAKCSAKYTPEPRAPRKVQVHNPKQGVCQRWNFSLLKNMLRFFAFSWRGRQKPTDISFQVSIPLNSQQERGSYSSKGKGFLDQTR